jgi:hypothetical protein
VSHDDERKDPFPDERITQSLCPACLDPVTHFPTGMNILVTGSTHRGVRCELCRGDLYVSPTVAAAWEREHGAAPPPKSDPEPGA